MRRVVHRLRRTVLISAGSEFLAGDRLHATAKERADRSSLQRAASRLAVLAGFMVLGWLFSSAEASAAEVPLLAPVTDTVSNSSQPAAALLAPVSPVVSATGDRAAAVTEQVAKPLIAPVAQTVAPVSQALAPVVTPLTGPVARTLEPVTASVGGVLEPVTAPVGGVLEPVTAPVGGSVAPPEEIKPVNRAGSLPRRAPAVPLTVPTPALSDLAQPSANQSGLSAVESSDHATTDAASAGSPFGRNTPGDSWPELPLPIGPSAPVAPGTALSTEQAPTHASAVGASNSFAGVSGQEWLTTRSTTSHLLQRANEPTFAPD